MARIIVRVLPFQTTLLFQLASRWPPLRGESKVGTQGSKELKRVSELGVEKILVMGVGTRN